MVRRCRNGPKDNQPAEAARSEMRVTVLWVLAGLAFSLFEARPARADSVELAGDVLQYGIPAIALGIAGVRRDLSGVGYLAASGFVTEALVWTLKLTVDEERPTGGGRGFPSGHSATAAFGAGFVHRRYGLLPALPLYVGTGFVAWSRVESRAHRTLDVVAGIAIGIGASMVITKPGENEFVVVPLALDDGLGALLMLRF